MDSDSPSFSEYDESEWTDRPQYSYQPLQADEIRILHLLPGRPGDILRAVMEHVTLATDGQAEYEAISYAWGSKDKPFDIVLEDSNTCLSVTQGLHDALESLRFTEGIRALWADAVCINQGDVEERSTQVAIMHEVYRKSSKVLVWLGRADSSNDAAFAIIEACSKVPIALRLGDDTHCSALTESLTFTLKHEALDVLDRCLYSFGLLLQRPWFSRLWVVQEVTVGRKVRVYCGKRSVTWEKFVSCALQLSELRKDALAGGKHIRKLDRNWMDIVCETLNQINARRGSNKTTFSAERFLSAMVLFSTRLCEESLDRIYSLRQFLGLHEMDGLAPNYRLPCRTVYRRVTDLCLADAELSAAALPPAALLFGLKGTELANSGLASPDHHHWPSWVPDYDNLSESSRRKHARYMRQDLDQFQWTDDSTLRINETANERNNYSRMTIRALVLGSVISVAPSTAFPSIHPRGNIGDARYEAEVLPKLVQWATACADYMDEGPAEPNLLRMVLCCDDPHIDNVLPLANFVQLDTMQSKSLTTAKWLWQSLNPFLGLDRHPRHDSSRILCHLLVHDTTTAAWVPSSTRAGDFLALFPGTPYALVLRQHDEFSNHFVLGDAYICGFSARINITEWNAGETIQSEVRRARIIYNKSNIERIKPTDAKGKGVRWSWIALS